MRLSLSCSPKTYSYNIEKKPIFYYNILGLLYAKRTRLGVYTTKKGRRLKHNA